MDASNARSRRSPATRRRRVAGMACALVVLVTLGIATRAMHRHGAHQLLGSSLHELTVDGVQRTYLLSVPHGIESDAVPVVFAFHGHGQDATQMEGYTGLDAEPAIIVYPEGEKGQGGERAWESAPYASTNTNSQDTRMVFAILADLEQRHRIDTHRIYAVGKSNGGGFAAELACRHPQTFAAVASVSGAYYPPTHQSCAVQATSFLEIHGLKDSVIPYVGSNRNGSSVLGALQMSRLAARRAHCAPNAVEHDLTPTVRTFSWTGCHGDIDVTHEQVTDGDHTWPGAAPGTKSGPGNVDDSINATQLIWAFLQRHHS